MNSEIPHVSVIIPTYNRAGFLKEALDSVRAQSYADFETIVVDDGSTDDTPSVLSEAGQHLVVVRQANQGVSAARNTGVAHARGTWLAFLDSDDLWHPAKLACQMEVLGQHPDWRICQTDETWIRNGVRVNPRLRHQKPSGMIFEASLALCLVSPSAVIIHRDLFAEMGGFDVDFPACEDYDLWLRISRQTPIYLIPEQLVVKRGGHADQLSRMPALDRYRIRAIKQLIESGTLTATQQAASVTMLKQKCAIYAAGCRKRERLDEAREYESLASQYGCPSL